ncbi:unnamed protein product [Dovyalis caffra]|uniref:Uncharacterized protein n=1 Tax=Dovyalis caffra TaxID=77055 RepID=A0AAV1RQW1_9ROSI|nr:unnamed protein product [Dovyalis caffra]
MYVGLWLDANVPREAYYTRACKGGLSHVGKCDGRLDKASRVLGHGLIESATSVVCWEKRGYFMLGRGVGGGAIGMDECR